MKKLFILLLSLVPIIPKQAFCQPANRIDITPITSREGLSNSSVNCIMQDSKERMWFGTWDGLNLYNGITFKSFHPDPSEHGTISNAVIRDIVEQKNGTIWVATDMGINRYDENRDEFTNWFDDAEALSISTEKAFILGKDSMDRIHVFIKGNGAYRFNESKGGFEKIWNIRDCRQVCIGKTGIWALQSDSKLIKYILDDSAIVISEEEIQHNINLIFPDKDSTSIFYQHEDGRLFNREFETPGETLIGTFPKINCGYAKDNSLLLGGEFGLVSYDITNGASKALSTNAHFLSITEGTQGIIWAGTDMMGVWKFALNQNGEFHGYPDKGSNLFSGKAVRCFDKDNDGHLLVGTKGDGIHIMGSPDGQVVSHLTTANGLIDNAVFAIAKDDFSINWIGTDGRGLNYIENGTLKTLEVPDNCEMGSVYAILPWGNNELWVGTSGNGLFRLRLDRSGKRVSVKEFKQYRSDMPNSIPSNIVYAIERKDDSGIWIGTRGRGVVLYDIPSDTFIPFTSELSHRDVLSMLYERSGRLWVGTSSGLFVFSDTNNTSKPTKITEKDHLPSNTIHALLMDMNGSLWASTNSGIARIKESGNSYNVVPYYIEDGLYGNEFTDGAAFAYSDNSFLFGNINGYTSFSPLKVKNATYQPSFVLEQLRIDNEEAHLVDYIDPSDNCFVIPRGTKSISLTYVAVDYLNANKRSISYKVEGMDNDWIDLGYSGTIVLNRMKPGRHTLEVRCSGPEGTWNEPGVKLPLYVQSAWYASAWAILVYILIGALSIGLSVITFRQRKKKGTIITAHEAKLDFFTGIAHEFSNSLTLIYGPCVQILRNPSTDYKTRHYAHLIEENSERMRTMIQDLIDFRKAETGHLKIHCNKVDIEALAKKTTDFFSEELQEHHIDIRTEITPEGISWLTDYSCLEKILFNLLSNAVKYTPENNDIIVAITQKKEKLVLTVTNYGVGIEEAKRKLIFNSYEVLRRYEKNVAKGRASSNGIGLATCKDLARLLGGSIEIESDGTNYVRFVVEIPQMSESPEDVIETSSIDQRRTIQYFTPSKIKKEEIEVKPKGKSMLVVDDDEEILKFISDLFSYKFDITQARNGEEALSSIRQQTPEIIISDIVMPRMNGIELLRILKADDITRHIPIILLSTKNTVEDQIQGLTEGADSYVSKPFNPKQLSAVVDSLLNRDKAVLEYSNSSNAAMDLYSGKVVTKETKRLLSKVTDVVIKNISNENMTLDDIAEKTATSKMKIYRAIKTSLEVTPTEYIRSLRLQHAEKLLRTTKMTVQEIMYECGFSSKAYFHKVFFNKYGHTPKEYRQSR